MIFQLYGRWSCSIPFESSGQGESESVGMFSISGQGAELQAVEGDRKKIYNQNFYVFWTFLDMLNQNIYSFR